jgi:diacylglycerol kinase (ATP)
MNHSFKEKKRGIRRIYFAFINSLSGLKFGWSESAFKQETLIFVIALPTSFWIGRNWVEIVILNGSIVFVLTVELLNTAIEVTHDRISTNWNKSTKVAKDLGSAAVFISFLFCIVVWITAFFRSIIFV